MAKKRRKNRKAVIKVWTCRHDNVLNALARMSVIRIENVRKVSTVANHMMSENALLDMIELGFIKTEKIEYKGKIEKIVMLDKKGISKIRKIDSKLTNNIYNSSSVSHDLEHSNFIFENFDISDIQKFYRSEKELLKLCKYKSYDSTPTDGAFIYDDGRQNIFVETTTQHYTKGMKMKHELYAHQNGGVYVNNPVRIPKKSL